MNREQFATWYCGVRENCTKSTGVTTFYSIKKIRKNLDLDVKIPKGHSWITKRVYAYLKNVDKLVTRKNLSVALVSYLKALKAPEKKIKEATQFMLKYAKEVDQIYKNQKKSIKQSANWVDAKELKQFVKEKTNQVAARKLLSKEKWSLSDKKLAYDYLILILHSNNPPRLEFAQLVYTKKADKPATGNYLYQKKKQWYALINEHKTSRKKGPFVVKFGNSVSRVLNKFRKYFKEEKPVFINKKGKMMSRNSYGKRISRIMKDRFGKNISASMLRTIFLSDMYSGLQPLKQMEERAKNMGHSLQTALGKYVKLDK